MAVQDLPKETAGSEDAQSATNAVASSSSYDGSQGGTLPAPSPARFLTHPLLRRREPSTADADDDDILPVPSNVTSIATNDVDDSDVDDSTKQSYDQYGNTYSHEISTDVTDELLSVSGRHHAAFSHLATKKINFKWHEGKGSPISQEIELGPLLSRAVAMPGSSQASTVSSVYKYTTSSSPTLVQLSRDLGPHTPVALSKILARDAAPLSLPRLDGYISSLPAPSFPSLQQQKGKGKDTPVTMFPPMGQLAGRMLADLENNAEIAPTWRNRNIIFATITSVVLDITGFVSFYSAQGLFDTLQIFALILSTLTSSGKGVEDRWRKVFLVTIPNALALNFASTLVQSLISIAVFMTISAILLFFFYRMTSACRSLGIPEGLQQTNYFKHTWALVIVSFLLTLIYLPLSTMAVHILVWSDELWVVPNPYTNATSSPPDVAPLGPSDEYRDPLDFCWTTTMKRNEVNYAPFVVIAAVVCFFGLTVWFPIHLYSTIRGVTPIVDRYTELGTPRSNSEMDREYQRLLDRDRNPLSFLYNGFRRGWGTYESLFLLGKLTALLLTAIVDPDNCLFRTLTRSRIQIARQILLLIAMLVFFVMQCVLSPFLDPVNNASEWTSRLNYVLTSAVSLVVALNIPGKDIFNGPVLYVIYIVTYGLSMYFTIINTSRMRRVVKRLARRIDFSIDIFSPRLDLTSSSPHTKRRIWQEAITTLFLTSSDCQIPRKQKMEFKQSRDGEYPPYLLGFSGSPGERHVENLHILREVGSVAYNKAVALVSGPDYAWFKYLEESIQDNFIGPDCYWESPGAAQLGCTKFFGNAWWIPFPPMLVIRYDDGPLTVLRHVADFELYLAQNSRHDIQSKRQIRMALRALDGQSVVWPYDHIPPAGTDKAWCCCGRRYGAHKCTHYKACVFHVQRRGHVLWEGLELGSGFDVKLVYDKNVQIGGWVIGLTDDYNMTRQLARFLALNKRLIPDRLSYIETVIQNYRHYFKRECEWKRHTLTYRFLSAVYDQPQEPTGVVNSTIDFERDPRVRELVVSSETVLQVTYERMIAVSTTELATWWYIFWDDLWRRNWDTISALSKHATDFNPHYPTSIAYNPLPRAALEAFLTQRGLLHKVPKWADFFHAGFLNKIYLRMNDIAFHGSDGAVIFHLGDDASELDMEDIDLQTLARPSTLGTGGGTDHDDESIRARPAYRWEGILEDPLRKTKSRHQRLLAKFGVGSG
ncbi:hypothetical protein A0H81_01055 [Grifola frondosa]|uniref:Uncharacterized protein n=1 Tax=Grifola frondosa TaxID=5627 RepID=A0A1C7MSJ0_GRIFR|nr:hypothetical protein A0H81_01055 [Grifola frondosa]